MRSVVVDKRGPKRDWVRLVRARKKRHGLDAGAIQLSCAMFIANLFRYRGYVTVSIKSLFPGLSIRRGCVYTANVVSRYYRL